MQTLTPQQKLSLMRNAQKDLGLAILELHGHLEKQMEDKISEMLADKKGEPGDVGPRPSDEELLSLITPLIPALPKVIHGKTPTKEELTPLIKSLIPKVKNGEKPKKEELLSLINSVMPSPEDMMPTEEHLTEIIKPLIPKIELPDIEEIVLRIVNNIEIDASRIRNLPRPKKESGKYLHGAGAGGANLVFNEIPSGTINGINNIFTIANIPVFGSLRVYMNGQRLAVGSDYTLVGKTITFVNTPISGSIIIVDYSNI